MSPWRERLRRLARGIPLGHHLPPLVVLACTLRGADGIPERVIPWDFPTGRPSVRAQTISRVRYA